MDEQSERIPLYDERGGGKRLIGHVDGITADEDGVRGTAHVTMNEGESPPTEVSLGFRVPTIPAPNLSGVREFQAAAAEAGPALAKATEGLSAIGAALREAVAVTGANSKSLSLLASLHGAPKSAPHPDVMTPRERALWVKQNGGNHGPRPRGHRRR